MGISSDLAWWITVFDLPAMAGLFWLIWRTCQDSETDVGAMHALFVRRNDKLRGGLKGCNRRVSRT